MVDKSRGPTSHDVVMVVRRTLKIKKVGHCGTLDPSATGVLVLCLGRATRIVELLIDADKEYLVEACLGVSTDTFDADGQVTGQADISGVTKSQIESVCVAFQGEILQEPPMFSAVKVGGRRLYKLARAGKTVQRSRRRVTISEITVVAYEPPALTLRVVCSKGTYVRALVEDLGGHLGCGAHVRALRRLRSGVFTVDQAVSFDQIEALHGEGNLVRRVCSLDEALSDLLCVVLSAYEARLFSHGTSVRMDSSAFEEKSKSGPPLRVKVKDPGGRLRGVGVLDVSENLLKPWRVFE